MKKMKKMFRQPKVIALIELMKSIGVLCDIVRIMKRELQKEGFTDDDLNTIEEMSGQHF